MEKRESLVTIFWGKIFEFFVADSGSGALLTLDPGWKIRIRDKHTGSPTLRLCLKIWEEIIMNIDNQILMRSPPNLLSEWVPMLQATSEFSGCRINCLNLVDY